MRALQDLGCRRVILARELSLADIRRIRDACPGIELEAFVLGAQCFGISGRCLLGEAVGGRGGNHGTCLQACRLPFTDETGRTLGHLLSMKDLDALRRIPELVDAGVVSLKIEGRLKSPSWVGCASTWISLAAARWRDGPLSPQQYAAFDQDLSTLFSRPRTDAFLDGIHDAAEVTAADAPGHRGLSLPFRVKTVGGVTYLALRAPVTLSRRDGLLVRRRVRGATPQDEPEAIRELRDSRGRFAGSVDAGAEALVALRDLDAVTAVAIHSAQSVEAAYQPDPALLADLERPAVPAPQVLSLSLENGLLSLTLESGRFRRTTRFAVDTVPARGQGFGPAQAARLFPGATVAAAEGLYVSPSQLKARRREAREGFLTAIEEEADALAARLAAVAEGIDHRFSDGDAVLLDRGPTAVSRVTGLPQGSIVSNGGDRFRLRPATRGTVVDWDRRK